MPAVYDPEQLERKEQDNPAKEKPVEEQADSPGGLNQAEKAAGNPTQHENTVGKGYKPGGGEHQASLRSRLIKGRGRKTVIGGSIAALIIAAAVALFIAFIPLKILHIVNNLQSRFYATSENAVDKEVDRLFSHYVKTKIKLGNCGPVIDSSCNPFTAGDSLVTRLYRGWSNGRLEERMQKQGFEIRRGPSGYEIRYKNEPRLTAALGNDFPNNTDTIDDVLRKNGSWSPATRNEIRQAFRSSMEGETRWKRTMYYFKVGKLLERKYGIKRCIIGCKVKDDYADWKDNKRRALKMVIAQRVMGPKAAMYIYVFQCMLSPASTGCAPDDFKTTTPEPYNAESRGCVLGCDDNGQPLSNAEREIRNTILLRRLATLYDGDVAKLDREYNDFKNGGIGALMIRYISGLAGDQGTDARGKSLLGNLATTKAIQGATQVIPIVGQVIAAAAIVGFIDTSAEAIPKMVYVMNSTAAAQFFAMYRTHADEIKEGKVDAEIVGSFVDGLGPGVLIDATEQNQIGGTAGAEQAPLYGAIIGNTETQTKFASMLGALAPEASAQVATYKCSDGQPVPAGKLVCDEEIIKQDGNGVIGAINAMRSDPAWKLLSRAADAVNKGVHAIGGILRDFVGYACKVLNIFGLCDALENAANRLISALAGFAKGPLEEALKFVFGTILGFNLNQISTHQSGGRSFDMAAAGADVSGNVYAHHGLGGRELSKEEVALILNEQAEQRRIAYESQPFLSRMLDTESEHSPLVKLAMAMPTNKTSAVNGVLAKFSNPFKLISSIFGNLLSPPFVSAQPVPKVIDDPFGITQYGYPQNDPTLVQDPDDFWNQNCVGSNSLTHLYNNYASKNLDDSYTPVNDVPGAAKQFGAELASRSPAGTNRCLLIQAAAGSTGAIFTDEVLTPEELADSTPPPVGGGPIDCNAQTGIDQSPGTPPADIPGFAAAVAAQAQGRTCPGTPTPAGAVPNDPNLQYMAYEGCGADGCFIETDSNGRHYIVVKYRDPPGSGNTINVYLD